MKGKKTWEIRGSNTNIRGRIALIKSGSGKIFGTVDLIDSKKITLSEYQEGEPFHCAPREDCLESPYMNIYAWVLENPVLFDEPKQYKHPMGAVIWVNLP